MAKVYDPILCMMVDKPDKAQDVANGWKVTVEQNLKKYEVLSSAMSASGAKLEAQKQYPNGTVLKVERATVKDAAYEIKEIGEPKYSIDKSKKFGLFVNGKLVARAVSKEAAEKMYETFYKKKAQDANKYVEQAIKWMKEGKGRLEIIAGLNQMGLTPSDVASYYAEASLATGYKAKDSASVLDEAIRVCDASTGHKVVVFVENYLRSIGKNNSTGKYDRIVQGVRSLLSQSLLDDEGLKKAAEHEADRLLKKYNL